MPIMSISIFEPKKYKYSLAQRVSKKLESLRKWENITVNWCPIIQEYIIDAIEIVFNEKHYLNFLTFIPIYCSDQLDHHLLLKLYEDLKNQQENQIYKQQYIFAIVGLENNIILHSINLELEQ